MVIFHKHGDFPVKMAIEIVDLALKKWWISSQPRLTSGKHRLKKLSWEIIGFAWRIHCSIDLQNGILKHKK
jgi:hypothetical protein